MVCNTGFTSLALVWLGWGPQPIRLLFVLEPWLWSPVKSWGPVGFLGICWVMPERKDYIHSRWSIGQMVCLIPSPKNQHPQETCWRIDSVCLETMPRRKIEHRHYRHRPLRDSGGCGVKTRCRTASLCETFQAARNRLLMMRVDLFLTCYVTFDGWQIIVICIMMCVYLFMWLILFDIVWLILSRMVVLHHLWRLTVLLIYWKSSKSLNWKVSVFFSSTWFLEEKQMLGRVSIWGWNGWHLELGWGTWVFKARRGCSLGISDQQQY